MSLNKQILIVDIEPFKRGGHFKYWYHLFAEILHTKACITGIVNDNVDDQSKSHFSDLIKLNQEDNIVSLIDQWLNLHIKEEKIIILMWAYDYQIHFDELDKIINPHNVKLFSIAAISHYLRNSVHKNASRDDAYILDFFGKREAKWKILIWDQFLNIKLPNQSNLLPLPDVPNMSYEKFEFPDYLNQKIKSYKYVVGFVGMMFGYRGMSMILNQHAKSKDTLFLCWGPYNKNMLPLMQRGKMNRALNGEIDNIVAINEHLPEGKLTYILSKIDFLFIASNSYPVSSSISIRAATMGKKIITDKANAAINDMIVRYDCGYIIDDFSSLSNLSKVSVNNSFTNSNLLDWYSKNSLEIALNNYFELT
jgi:hypothetical protein